MTRGATRGSVLTTWRFWVRSIGSESPGAGVRVKRRARAPVARREQPPNKMPAVDAAPPIVDARGLCKDYGTRRVVTDVSFALGCGECLGLLGPNGAGKTTTIRMVTCFTAPSAGTLAVLGLPTTPTNHAAIKGGLGVVQQDESLDPDLSVEQNLIVYASYFGIARRDATPRAEALMRFAELTEHRTARIRTLSGGMKRRLMLARALLNEPRLLVLDEPTTGLDPQARRLVWERIRTLKRQGTTILLTTHYMEEAAQLCDRTIIMDHGRIVAEGSPAELVAALGEPIFYLLAIGYGLGRFVAQIDGLPYAAFLAPGMIAFTAMNSATFETTFGSFTRMTQQNTYAAILATPCSVADIVAGDVLWAASKSTLSVCFVLLLTALFGLVASPLALALVPVGFLVGLMFGGLGMMVTARAPSYDFFNYYFTLGISVMFLFSGVFFPLESPPAWAR